MTITVTEKAQEKLIASGVNQETFLRLGVQQGGCAGLSYAAFLDNQMSDSDSIVYENTPLTIVADEAFLTMIDGLHIEYSDDLIQPGFILKNPNSQKSCGCGSSFKAREEDAITPCGGRCG